VLFYLENSSSSKSISQLKEVSSILFKQNVNGLSRQEQ